MKWDTDHNAAPDTVSRGAIGIRRQCIAVVGITIAILSADGEVDNVEDDAEAASDDEQ